MAAGATDSGKAVRCVFCRLTGVDISSCSEKPTAGWPVAITLSGKQGKALQSALAGGPMSITVAVPAVPAQKEIGLAAYSGMLLLLRGCCQTCATCW